jgi:chorismate mutase
MTRSIYAAKQKQMIQRSKRQEEQPRAMLTLYQSDEHHEEIERAKQTLARIVEERLQLAKIAAGIKWDVSIETPSKYVTARIKARETQRLKKSKNVVGQTRSIAWSYHHN